MSKKDRKVREILESTWTVIKGEIPGLFDMFSQDINVVLSGKHLDASKEILAKMEKDILALKNGEIDKIEFAELVRRRKAALFTLYNAEKISRSQPSVQKVLDAAVRIAEKLAVAAIPIILGL